MHLNNEFNKKFKKIINNKNNKQSIIIKYHKLIKILKKLSSKIEKT